ncbi:MAG: hypothetical protein ACLFNB_01975 [Candidatus Woesearchaeota archaeon]
MDNKTTNRLMIMLTIVIALGTLADVMIASVTTSWSLESLPTGIIIAIIAMIMGALIYAAITTLFSK